MGGKYLARKPLHEALELLLAWASLSSTTTVATESAQGLVAAGPILAAHPAPHYRASAMDGIAVRAADTEEACDETVVTLAEIAPGTDPGTRRGVCQVIDTGGALPGWADAVVRIEDTARGEAGFALRAAVPPGCDVRRAGEDIDQGSRIVRRGQRIGAYDIGALLATGVYEVEVRQRPRVAIIATGGEVVEPVVGGRAAAPGEVIEYNSRMISASLRDWGGEGFYLGRVEDDEAALEKAFREAVASYDVVAIIAGSSVGRKDLTVEVLRRCGEVFVHGIDIMPGKPVALAAIDATPVVGLPGYPVSTVVACEQLLKPLVAAMTGAAPEGPETVRAEVRRKIVSRLGVEEFRRVCLARDGEALVVAPLARGAGSISSVAHADGWLRIPASSEGVDAGAVATVELMVPASALADSIVVAGPCRPTTVALEDELRKARPQIRFSHLGLASEDAVEALCAGEAGLAIFDLDGGEAIADESRARLQSRVPGVRIVDLQGGAEQSARFAVLSGALLASRGGAKLLELLCEAESKSWG